MARGRDKKGKRIRKSRTKRRRPQPKNKKRLRTSENKVYKIEPSHSESYSDSYSEKSSGEEYKPEQPAKKIKDEQVKEGFIVFDVNCLLNLLSGLIFCSRCKSELKLYEKCGSRVGIFSKYYFYCENCKSSTNLQGNSKVKDNIEEVNFRLFYGLRSIGIGEQTIKTFCALMNLNQPTSKSDKYQEALLNSVEHVAEKSMNSAAKELKDYYGDDKVTCGFDCSWPKRGFTSILGVMTCCSPILKKVIDTIAICKKCNKCKGQNIDEKNCGCNYSGKRYLYL